MLKRTLFFGILVFPCNVFTQSEFYQVGGYVKYLYSNTDHPTYGRVNDHLIHSRINSKLYCSEAITAAAELRNRIFYGGSVEKTPNFLTSIRSHHDIGDADIVWWNTHTSVAHSEVDRFFVDATYNKLQLTLGRQRIAWGTALVWNPIDLFNPFSILDFDYEVRPGVDALRAQYFTGEVTTIELAVKPGSTSSRRIVAGKLLLNHWHYDVHFIGGAYGKNIFFGTAWAGDIAGAGFRGEMMAREITAAIRMRFPQLHSSWSLSVVLSMDYTLTNNTYLHTEVLYNNQGTTANTALFLPVSLSLGLLSPARWSVFQELSFDVHPLVRISGFMIYNPNDNSSVIVPSALWSVTENIDVSFYGLIFSGAPTTEFGLYGTSIVVRGTYSF